MTEAQRKTPAAGGGPRAPKTTTLERIDGHEHTAVPVDLQSFQRIRSATEDELTEVLRAHALAVRSWNLQERAADVPLPRMFQAGAFSFMPWIGRRRQKGVVAFRRTDNAAFFLKTTRWHPWVSGLACIRNPLEHKHVTEADLRRATL